MSWWQNGLMLVLAFIALLIRFVPWSEWTKWRTWFHPAKYEPGDDEDDRPQEPNEPGESDAPAVGGAGTVLDVGPTDPSLLRGIGSVVLVFVLGSLVGYNWALIRDEPDVPPLETALAIGGFYAVLLGGGLVCARIYHRVRPPGSPPSGLAESGWARSALALTPVRVAVSIVGLLALLAILLLALLPYGVVTAGGEEHRCGSPLVQMIRPDDGQLAPRASGGSADGAVEGNKPCLSEAKHRRGLLVAFSAMTLVGVGSAWLVSGGKGNEHP